jgi:predicted  nucleic acid-binding Zn-ribbon protein
MFTPGSKKKVWWKCSKCGNEWMAVIRSRSVGCGCPICGYKKAGQKISKKVAMFSSETNIILKTFNSIKEAVEKTGISRPTITSKCKGFRTSKDNFYWKYI